MEALEYNYIPPEGDVKRHMWTAVGEKGGIHIWAQPHLPDFAERWGEKFFGGIEKHSKVAMYEYNAGKPDHKDCWLLKCPCWHDGSSLYFSERIGPLLQEGGEPFPPHIHEYMNSLMADWYRSHFADQEAA